MTEMGCFWLRRLMLVFAAAFFSGCGVTSVRTQADEEIRVVLPATEYSLIDAVREGMPEILTVDGALRGLEHKEAFVWHLRIQLEAEQLANQGMPTSEESKLLFEIGDQIEAVVLGGRTKRDAPNALFLSRSTWNGIRELEYRVHDPEVAHKSLQALLGQKHAREWSYRMFEDAVWDEPGKLFALLGAAQK